MFTLRQAFDGPERAPSSPPKEPAPRPPRAAAEQTTLATSDMRAAIDELLLDWLTGGDVEPEPVELRPLPPDALNVEHAVARFAAFVQGLWLYDGQRLPMILAREWVARWLADPRMAAITGLKRPVKGRQIGNVLATLTKWGVLEIVGETKIAGQPRAAYLYALGVAGRRDEVAGLRGQEPSAHDVDELLMGRAELQGPLRPLDAAVGVAADGERLHDPMMPETADAATLTGSAAKHYAEDVWR